MQFIDDLIADPVTLVLAIIAAAVLLFGVVFFTLNGRLLGLVLKNLRRNLVRTMLTCTATMVLVFVITMIWTVLYFMDLITRERSKDLKLIISERRQVPSTMPRSHAAYLDPSDRRFLPELRGMYGPNDFMTWSFYGGSMDAKKLTPENLVFFFTMDPDRVIPMMDDLEGLDPALIDKMKAKREAVLIGIDKLRSIGQEDALRRNGSVRVKLTSMNYKDIDLEFEVVGVFPDGRYDKSAVMNRDYLNAALDAYPRSHAGQKHPLADKTLNLVWLRVPDMLAFNTVQEQISRSPLYTSPAVKCETASSGIATFLEAYRDLIWGMRWLLAPAILLTLSLVIANAISISVRERRLEFAVLRVLGFRPRQVLALVVGEAVLLGAGSGLFSTVATYTLINKVMGGINFPIAFFGSFFIPLQAIWWGLAIGVCTALAGSVVPAITASSTRVTEAFSKVA